MKRSILKAALLGASLAIAATGAAGQAKMDIGKREYDANCSSCHGPKGLGDGPNKPYLTRSPTDLTTLAKANGGVLPVSRLYESIEGTRAVPGHGTRDMPTWGYEYRVKAASTTWTCRTTLKRMCAGESLPSLTTSRGYR